MVFLLSLIYCGEQCGRLSLRLDPFLVRHRVRDYSGTGLEIAIAVLGAKGSDCYGKISASVTREVTDSSRVGTSCCGFQFINDFNRPNLRSSRYRSAGNDPFILIET